jgi:hypothetical protein
MKVSGLLLLFMLFVVVPFLLLQTLLMPALDQLKQTYAGADSIAQTVAQD